MRARLGTAQAITATAHKLARVVYHVLHNKEPYTETVFHRCDEQEQQRAEMRLRKHAAQLGFQLLPISTKLSNLVPEEIGSNKAIATDRQDRRVPGSASAQP